MAVVPEYDYGAALEVDVAWEYWLLVQFLTMLKGNGASIGAKELY